MRQIASPLVAAGHRDCGSAGKSIGGRSGNWEFVACSRAHSTGFAMTGLGGLAMKRSYTSTNNTVRKL